VLKIIKVFWFFFSKKNFFLAYVTDKDHERNIPSPKTRRPARRAGGGGKDRSLYTANEASRAAAEAGGVNLSDVVGTGTWELPQPAAIVIGQDRVVHFADVSPDWLVRTEAEPIL
jgi:hypothetical protein